MKTRIIIALFIIVFSFQMFAQEKIAVMLKVKGVVMVENAKTKKRINARMGMPLKDGDKVLTGKKSFAAVRFLDDKSLVRVRESSICTIEGKKQQKKIEKSIWVEVGTFFMSIFKQKSSFKVITPTSVASIKGTKFWAIHTPSGGTRYVGIEGIVEIKNDKGSALMKKGETCIVKSKDTPPIVRLTKEGDIPEDADQVQGKMLELEFENKDGQQRQLKIELRNK